MDRRGEKLKPGLTFHGFTRISVRDMYIAGATKIEIMAAVGHTTPKMVDVYLQEIESDEKRASAWPRSRSRR